MTTLESVRAKVVKAVPEAFSRGVVVGALATVGELSGRITSIGEQAMYSGGKWVEIEGQTGRFAISLVKVTISITLADVLRAIGEVVEDSEMTEYAIDHHGWFFRYEENDGEPLIQWNLALPLDDQSPEVWEFLDKILTN